MTTTTFHRAKNGKLAPCRATVRPCPKGEHIMLDEQQQAFLKEAFGIVDVPTSAQAQPPAVSLADFTNSTDSQSGAPQAEAQERKQRTLIEGLTFPPVIVTASPLHEPELTHADFSLAHNHEAKDVAFETADTYYGEVQIENVNLPQLLADMFKTKPQHIPAELLELAKSSELRLDSASSWIVTRGGYYDDDYTFECYNAELVQRKLNEWHFAQPNATDRDGVLAYCRAKGVETTGLTPLAALREQLTRENPGRTNPQVAAATGVHQRSLQFSKVAATPERLAAVEARPAKKPAGVTEYLDPIVGVVYPARSGRASDTEYVLVDGYHRFKDRTAAKKRVGEFLVLTRG